MSDAKADTMTPLFGMDNYSDVSSADTKDSGRSKRRTSVNNDTGVLFASSADDGGRGKSRFFERDGKTKSGRCTKPSAKGAIMSFKYCSTENDSPINSEKSVV